MKILLAALVFFFLLASGAPAIARGHCNFYEDLKQFLAEKWNEAPILRAISANGNLMVFFVSEDQSTWTIVSKSPGGVGCLVGSGEDLETVDWYIPGVAPELQSL